MGKWREWKKEKLFVKMHDTRCKSNLFLHPGCGILPEKAKEFQ